jgi:hypothetical protein
MPVLILFMILLLSACSIGHPVTPKRFSFYKDNKPSHISLKVPKGFQAEKMKLGNEGKEQFYEYADGSLLFIGMNISWPSPNQLRKLLPIIDSTSDRTGTFRGIDSSGLYWKEIWLEPFIIGYSFVPSTSRERFEQTLNSIRFR